MHVIRCETVPWDGPKFREKMIMKPRGFREDTMWINKKQTNLTHNGLIEIGEIQVSRAGFTQNIKKENSGEARSGRSLRLH